VPDKSLPQGIELTPLSPEFKEDPYPFFHLLRREAPVHRDEEFSRFILTREEDVQSVLRDPEMWTDGRKANPDSFARLFSARDDQEPSMLSLDDPDHRRLRQLVNKAFTPRAVEALRPRVRELVEKTLDAIADDEFDVMARFADPLPTTVIAEMLGIDRENWEQFKTWSNKSVAISFNMFKTEEDKAEGDEVQRQFNAFFYDEIEKRRSNPGEDLISAMVAVEEAGDKLTASEIVSQCNLLLIAGNVTTSDLIGNAISALLDHPKQLAKLRADESLINNTIEEVLRFNSPVVNSQRIAPRDLEIGGCPIKKGDTLTPVLGAANRDPNICPNPDRFDIERDEIQHHAFGGGRHFCLGAPLARLEGQEAILGLIRRFPSIRKSQKGAEFRAVPVFRGYASYWINVS